MNPHALRVLEYGRVREILAAYASSPLGRACAAGIEPLSEAGEVQARLEEAREMARLAEVARVPLAGLKDVAGEIRRLVDGGRPAEPELLRDVLEFLRGASALKESLLREPDAFPSLGLLAAGIEDLPELRAAIDSAIDVREGVRDDATERLLDLRRRARELRESIRERVARLRADSRLQRAFQAEGIKFKDDRYLLPVKADYRSWIAGVIRDRSQTGSTLYIEPDDLVLDGDALLEILDDERGEVRRILWELTRAAIAAEESLKQSQERAGLADLAHAKAAYARAFGLSFPEVAPAAPGEKLLLELRGARHPYLLWLARDTRRGLHDAGLEAARQAVVPLDVRLGDPCRLLIVTGPNTGGKTVALKTIGLNVLMALSGLPVAASPGARVPVFSEVFADIGDEQSIEQSLSTFSAHLAQIVEVLRRGDDRSLVLLDELGAGTDPLEGAALAAALLDWFHRRSWHAVITTHLGSLKEYAYTHEGAENAAMEFDAGSLEPTYRMITGLPGRSHAIEIARRAGIPEEIAGEAEEALRRAQAPTREVIEKLEHSHRRLEKERRRMERQRQRAQGERRAAEAEREEIVEEREVLRREAEALSEEVVRSARARLAPLIQKLQGVPRALLPVVEELRWTVDLMLTGTPLGERREEFARSLRKEDEVYVPKFRERCRVQKINKGARVITVLLNGIPTEVGFDDISWVER